MVEVVITLDFEVLIKTIASSKLCPTPESRHRVQLVRRVVQEPLVRGSNPSGARVQRFEGCRIPDWGFKPLRCWSDPPRLGFGAPHVQSGYTLA
jgi:hypothetical protein